MIGRTGKTILDEYILHLDTKLFYFFFGTTVLTRHTKN